MAKQTQIERAIQQLEADKAVIELAIAKLKQQQSKATTRKPREVKAAS